MLQDTALSALNTLFSPHQLFTDDTARIAYEADGGLDRGQPDAVVFPDSTEDVVRLVRWARVYHVPLIARGAGTGLSGGAVAERGGLVVAFSHMQAILAIDPQSRSALVQPAVINLALDQQVGEYGLYFPPDPASQRASTLGGNVAENAGGPHCFKYGVTTSYVTSLEVVLADGRALRLGGPAFDYPCGDLCGLLTGSEGTLALITAIGVRLLRRPPAVSTLLVTFDSLEQAGRAVSAIIAAGLLPATLEMMDQQIIRMVEPFAHAGLPLEAGAALLIEVDGYAASLAEQTQEITSILAAYGGHDLRMAENEEERARLWLARKSAAGAVTRLAPAYYTVDITVPRSRLTEMLTTVNRICQQQELRTGHVFHAGDGNLHPMLLIPDPENPALLERIRQAGHEIVQACVALDGSLSGEHGVGIEKRDYMPLMHTPEELQAMWDVKQVFDPQQLLNPGKIFPATLPSPSVEVASASGFAAAAPRLQEVLVATLYAPETAREAAAALGLLAKQRRPVYISGATTVEAAPFGPGTGNERGPGTQDGLLLSTAALRGIRAYAPDDLYITVGAGTTLAEIQEALAHRRQQLALVTPWPEATIGGLVAANVNAPLRMRYGALREQVLYATVALGDGRLIRTGRPITKNVAGYDLTRIFVGSYGTLGLLTEVTLKCSPQPRERRSLLLPAEDLRQALHWGCRLLPLALVASAILLCKGSSPAMLPASLHTPYLLIYSAEGLSGDVRTELAEACQLLAAEGAPSPIERSDVTGADLWCALMRGEGAQTSRQSTPAPPLVVRAGVPVGELPGYLQEQRDTLADSDFCADIAAGLLYVIGPFASETAPALLEALRGPAGRRGGYAVVMDMPRPYAALDLYGPSTPEVELMRSLKQRWDPQAVLNPGVRL
jgi:glycolate oxidase subunit GlcD